MHKETAGFFARRDISKQAAGNHSQINEMAQRGQVSGEAVRR
ncbi:hypothetical protein ACQKLN_25555 [Paenibacillus glucanolyticus]